MRTLWPERSAERRLHHLHFLEIAFHQDFRRRFALQVVLPDELRQNLGRLGERRPREERRAAQAASAAHEHQRHAILAVARRHRDHIGVVIGAGCDDLLRLNGLEVRQLVPQPRRILELQPLGCGFHAPTQFLLHLVVAAFQDLDRGAGIARIVLRRYQPNARRRAALDLVLQAGARAVRKIAVLAIAQAKQFLQLLQRFAHRTGGRIRAEVAAGLLARAAVEAQTRKFMLRLQMHEREALVVAQHDIEARPMLLDEIEFEQQRLGVRIRDGDFHRAPSSPPAPAPSGERCSAGNTNPPGS